MSDAQTLSLTEWRQKLGASLDRGLSRADAQSRLLKDGYNELAEKKVNPLWKFLGYFWGPIPWMIEAAMLLSAMVGHWSDFVIIALLLVVNSIVGFWEEYSAGNAIAALQAKLALGAKVLRDGAWSDIPARDLVPGDVIRVRLGDIIPADCVLLGEDPVEIDQSALTGESLPVTRDKGAAVYSGSILRQGETDALVTGTGKNTYLGKTAQLVGEAKNISHFQKAVLQIGDYLIYCALVLVALILVAAFLRRDAIFETIQFALVLTVAAVPVAMPTVLSVTMAVGARLLARKEAIVSRLAAIEEIAGMQVLCSDKTGTLTQNKLTLGPAFCLAGASADDVLLAASLASRREDQDPIDLAVLNSLEKPDQLKAYRVEKFQPFDPISKRTQALVQNAQGQSYSVAKGAPQAILALVANGPAIQAEVEQGFAAFAAKGYRSLGVARTDVSGTWQFLGILPMFDPLREDSQQTIKTAREMGIVVKMVTGDQVAIAKQTASELGLGTDILDASAMGAAGSPELTAEIERADGFAQVFPEHKYRIVETLQKAGDIVGMTGDGVNDAPALKKADVGIAVSNATDAARSAADIVLMTPGLSVIIEAIQESRRIFNRMNAYAIYRIAETIRVLLFMTLSILAFNFYPVTAIMIVLLALLNDGAILSIAYDRAEFSAKPESWRMKRVLSVATALGVYGVVESFFFFYMLDRHFHVSKELIQTMIYLKLSLAGHLTVFVARTRGPFWSSRPAGILLGAVVVTQLVATVITVAGLGMTAIPLAWALGVWGYCFLGFLLEDQIKLLVYRVMDRGETKLATA